MESCDETRPGLCEAFPQFTPFSRRASLLMKRFWLSVALIVVVGVPACGAWAQPVFVNGLALDGAMLDKTRGTDANNGRVGFFSDIYYEPQPDRWWGLSDRGPGGGSLHYA